MQSMEEVCYVSYQAWPSQLKVDREKRSLEVFLFLDTFLLRAEAHLEPATAGLGGTEDCYLSDILWHS